MNFAITLILSLLVTDSLAFTQPSLPFAHLSTAKATASSSTILFAKKKRRRRKTSSNDSSPPTKSSLSAPPSSPKSMDTGAPILDDEDELPDFDLIEDIDLEEAMADSTLTPGSIAAVAANSEPIMTPKKKNIDLKDPSVIAAQRAAKGTGETTVASTKDLLRSRNRELEQKLVVDEIVQDVPSFAEYNAKKGGRRSGSTMNAAASGDASDAGIGKKAMKREQRRAAALEAEGNVVEEENAIGETINGLLTKLPFVNDSYNEYGEKVEKKPIKVCISVLYMFLCVCNFRFFAKKIECR